jgi:hypothetical protein
MMRFSYNVIALGICHIIFLKGGAAATKGYGNTDRKQHN